MPALPARARAAIRSLLSRPHPSSARMSTATETSCSDSSELSGRPGVPLMTRSRDATSYAPRHPGVLLRTPQWAREEIRAARHPEELSDLREVRAGGSRVSAQAPAALSTCTCRLAPSWDNQPLLRACAII